MHPRVDGSSLLCSFFCVYFSADSLCACKSRKEKKVQFWSKHGKKFGVKALVKVRCTKKSRISTRKWREKKWTNKLEKNELSTAHTHVSNVFESYDALLYNHFTKWLVSYWIMSVLVDWCLLVSTKLRMFDTHEFWIAAYLNPIHFFKKNRIDKQSESLNVRVDEFVK